MTSIAPMGSARRAIELNAPKIASASVSRTAPIRAHVAAKLYGRPAPVRPANVAVRRDGAAKSHPAPATTIGQVIRVCIVLAVGLVLSPTPRFDAPPPPPVVKAVTK